MSKKKAPRGALHGLAGGSFSQKKKVVIGNVKHSGDEKNIFLNKSGSGGNVFSDVNSLSGDDDDASMSGFYGESPFGSAANTPKAKCVNTGAVFGSPLKSPNFAMNDVEIVKVPVEVSVKKSFALDINLLAVEGKSATAKTQVIRKIFSLVNGFGKATTLSKFEGIIRSTFTSEESMEVAVSLAREKEIVVNTNFKKQGMHSDWAVVLKKIPMDTPKDMIIATVSEFGEIKSIRIQLIGMWQKAVVEFAKSTSKWLFLIGKDSVHVARAVGDHNVWASRDCYRVLLFTLLMGTTAHNFGTLLNKVGGKTCVINCSLETGNRFCCIVVCFESTDDLNLVFLTEPILGGVWLSWARFDLVRCGKCGCLGHLALECDASNVSSPEFPSSSRKPASNANHLQLARLYAKKNVPISRPAAFAQVVSLASFSGGSFSGSGFGSGAFSLGVSNLGGGPSLLKNDNSSLNAHLASLEHSLELLHDQISGIVYRLGSINLVPFAPPLSSLGILDVSVTTSFDMILDDTLHDPVVALLLPLIGSNLGSSSSKVLTSKVDSLESKLVALDAFVGAILRKLDQLCTGLGFQTSSSSQ
ncbi:hypothetical protein G9A89_020628 [Geosiphon pyriformis]|nr:hypothetical protein G9A89_020628 [Geosiphon pyriformis]